MESIVTVLIIFGAVLIFFVRTFRIVPQAEVWVIESIGKYKESWNPGFHVLIPFLEHIAAKISTKEQTMDFPPQPMMTRDNLSIQIDAYAMFRVTDYYKFTYGCQDFANAFQSISQSALRGVVGELTLEECQNRRDAINARMTQDLDEATDKWGVKVSRLEISNIILPHEIQQANERQMKADRERRERLIAAEAERGALKQKAESDKETMILRSEAEKMAAEASAEAAKIKLVKAAEADKEASLLAAEADKIAALKKAEAEAEAILMVGRAQAESIRLLNAAAPSDAVLRIKAYDALIETAKGNANKLIIPSDIASVVGLAASVKECMNASAPKPAMPKM